MAPLFSTLSYIEAPQGLSHENGPIALTIGPLVATKLGGRLRCYWQLPFTMLPLFRQVSRLPGSPSTPLAASPALGFVPAWRS